jgi:hypothetical protein
VLKEAETTKEKLFIHPKPLQLLTRHSDWYELYETKLT